MGITQHKNSVATIQEIVNFQLLGGHIGRPGAGICPVRGHSNVQGDRTVGINHKPSSNFLSALANNTGIDVPIEHGVDTVEAVKLMKNFNTVFLSMGGNFLSAMSDTKKTASGLKNCNLTVQISTKPNRSHLVTGKKALILPCLGRTEIDTTSQGKQIVSVENSMGVVHSSQGSSKPISDNLKSETAIVAGIALSLETKISRNEVQWRNLSENYDNIRNLISSCISGFDNYNSKLRIKGGFYLPNSPRDNLTFNTKSGKAEFVKHNISSKKAKLNQFLMMTIRSHDQYNTTIYVAWLGEDGLVYRPQPQKTHPIPTETRQHYWEESRWALDTLRPVALGSRSMGQGKRSKEPRARFHAAKWRVFCHPRTL